LACVATDLTRFTYTHKLAHDKIQAERELAPGSGFRLPWTVLGLLLVLLALLIFPSRATILATMGGLLAAWILWIFHQLQKRGNKFVHALQGRPLTADDIQVLAGR